MYQRPDLPLTDLFREAHAIGYEAVEFWDRADVPDFSAALELARSCGLAVASMSGHRSLGDGLNDPSNHERIEGELRESIDLAAQFGIRGLICFSGNRRPGQSDGEGAITCAQGLRRIAAHAEARSINLNLELLNSRVDHPGYQCDRTDYGRAVCEMVGSPRVKLLYDIYHMQIMEGDIIRTIRQSIAHIGHFHTAGNPGRHEFDDTQELNYRGICSAISDTGYEGYVAHEFSPRGDVIDGLRHAFRVCSI
jgi:hydroxypyruvate isomerase